MGNQVLENTTAALTRLPAVTIEGVEYPTYRDDKGREVMQDLDIGRALELARPRDIRRVIVKHLSSLDEVSRVMCAKPNPEGGRPEDSFYLTEDQALFIAAKCRTKAATAQLKRLIAVYMEARRGNGTVAVALATGQAHVAATADPALLSELAAELRAGREERKATLGLLAQLTEQLRRPTLAAAPQEKKEQPAREPRGEACVSGSQIAARLGWTPGNFRIFLSRRNDLRNLQRSDGRWPLNATLKAIEERRTRVAEHVALPTIAAQAPADKRKSITDWVSKYCRLHSMRADEYALTWNSSYDLFMVSSGYDPRLLAPKGTRPIEVIEARGDLDKLWTAVLTVCPPRKMVEAEMRMREAEQLSLADRAVGNA